MTAPAAAPVSGAIVAPTPRAAPQAATDRFAFAAMLDSLPGAAAKTASSAAEEGSQTSNEPKQGQSPSGQSDGHPMLGDGAFLSSLPFALAASQAPAAAAPTPRCSRRRRPKGRGLGTSGASTAATVNLATPAPARLTGERAFHLALSTSGVFSGDLSPTAGPPFTGSPSSRRRRPPAKARTGRPDRRLSRRSRCKAVGRRMTRRPRRLPPQAPASRQPRRCPARPSARRSLLAQQAGRLIRA